MDRALMGRRPDFVIIGAMKGATSTLHEQLAAQPEVFMSTPKEPGFFSHDEHFARGIEWYESLFASAEDQQICGESSTYYTKRPEFPQSADRMVEMIPDAKLIYVIRHPVRRLVSHYIHAWSQKEYLGSIRRAVEEYAPLVDCGRYAMQLEPYLKAFGRNRILLVFSERLTSDSQNELERIGRFLGLKTTPRWNDNLGPANVSSERMRNSAARDAIVYAPGISQIRQCLPQSWRERVKRFWKMRKRPQLNAMQQAQLTAIFDEDLAQLGAWTETGLSCDSFDEIARSSTPRWSETLTHGIEVR